MFKEQYVKPVIKPAEGENALLKEKYQKPDMELVNLGVVAIIASSFTGGGPSVTSADPVPTATPEPSPTSTLEPEPSPTSTPEPTPT